MECNHDRKHTERYKISTKTFYFKFVGSCTNLYYVVLRGTWLGMANPSINLDIVLAKSCIGLEWITIYDFEKLGISLHG